MPFSTVSVLAGIAGLYPFALVVVASFTFIVGAVTFAQVLPFLTRTEITCCSVLSPSVRLPFVLSASATLKAIMLYCDLSIVFPSSSLSGTLLSLGLVGSFLSFGMYGITSLSDFFGLTVIFPCVSAVNGLPFLSFTDAVNGFLLWSF